MKKKVLSVALVLALAAIMVSATLAYFTAEDKATNTFTIGSVGIEIYENNLPTGNDAIPFGKLVPVVKDIPSDDQNYIPKSVTVLSNGDSDAYIRTHLAIPTALVEYLILEVNTTDWTWRFETTFTDAAGVEYTVQTYDYNAEVAPAAFTKELLKGVYLDSQVDLKEDANGNLVFIKRTQGVETHNSGFVAHTKNSNGTYSSVTVNLMVASQAIQAQGFDNVTTALDTGFGVNTNPWS